MNTALVTDRRDTTIDPSGAHEHTHRCWWDLYRAAWRCTGPTTVTAADPRPTAAEVGA